MLPLRVFHVLLLLASSMASGTPIKCNRIIDGTTMERSIAEDKYHFFMTLYNRTEIVTAYMPSTRYTVTIQADSAGLSPRKFTRFLISAEPENANETSDGGVFDLQDESLTKFSDNCPNAVVESSKVPKEEISVAWSSPAEGSGCILIRATILETPDTWYMDDSNLVLNICQDSKAEADDQGPVLSECCACEEAKYEVTFEGLWSRNTHPKDFPTKGWLIRFSDVIGASHTVDYRFWKYNGNATDGLRQVAELGSTRKLESELKDQSEHIRTIIKARGITYPNVTGRTFAVFRVDRKHHLMSLVSMIVPSPDWIVGVSGLELCLANCSWIEHKELNLYPYDAGTDDGITYVSPDAASDPQEPIRRITPTYPNDSRSPFYDPAGLDMKPLARLYLNRQRLYEKTCDDGPGEPDETGPGTTSKPSKSKACRVTPWGEYGECSVTCGRGYKLRQRKYRDEKTAHTNRCNKILTDRMTCYGESPQCANSGRDRELLESEMCALTKWSSWSSCTSSCGSGSKTRSRVFRHKNHRKYCKAVQGGPELQQTIDCGNPPCPGEEPEEVRKRFRQRPDEEGKEEGTEENADSEVVYDEDEDDNEDEDYAREQEGEEVTGEWSQKCPPERYTVWSLWTPCSSSCGAGVKLRSRLVHKNWDRLGEDSGESTPEECKIQQASCVSEIPTCDFTKEEAEKICSEPMVRGRCNGNILRVYFDKLSGRCRLFSYSGCDGNRNNFQTDQDCMSVCGNYQTPKTLEFKGIETESQVVESSEVKDSQVNCQVTEWSNWSSCNGCRGFTVSTRNITIPAKGGGKACPTKLMRRRKCHKIPPCSLRGDGEQYYIRESTEINEVSVDCKVTQWSPWSSCTTSCGEGLQYKSRNVRVQPRGPYGKLCPSMVELKKCQLMECS